MVMRNFGIARPRRVRKWTANERNALDGGAFVSSLDLGGAVTDVPIRHDVVEHPVVLQPPELRSVNPMCALCQRNRAPGATLPSLNEGCGSSSLLSPPRFSLSFSFPLLLFHFLFPEEESGPEAECS